MSIPRFLIILLLKILPIVIIIGVKEALTKFAQNVGKNLTIIVEIRNILETCFGNTQILRMLSRFKNLVMLNLTTMSQTLEYLMIITILLKK